MIGQIVLPDGIRWMGPVIKFIKWKVDLISSSNIYLIDDAHVFSQSSPKSFRYLFYEVGIPLHKPYSYSLYRCFGFLHFRYLKMFGEITSNQPPFCAAFFGLSVFWNAKKNTCQSSNYLAWPLQKLGVERKNQWRKKVGWKGSYVLGGSTPLWSAMGTHNSTSIFLLFWLPIFGRAEKTSMVFGKPRVKRRVSLSITGSFKPFKLTTHLSDPPSGNIELDPTPPERRMQSWQIKEGFFCFQGFLILKMFAVILVLTGIRGGVWTQNMSNRILFRKMNK